MSIPGSIPQPENEAIRQSLVERCDELFEQVLLEPEKLGYTPSEYGRSEYLALVDAGTSDSVFLYRDVFEGREAEAESYPYRVSENLDSYDLETGEPDIMPLQCFIDRYGEFVMPLAIDGRIKLVTAPRGLVDRYADLIRTGIPMRLA